MKTFESDKDEDQIIIIKILKMIHCLSYDVYNKNIEEMDFLDEVDVIKQNRQTVMNSENDNFFKSVIEKFLELKVRTMAKVYENSPEIWYG